MIYDLTEISDAKKKNVLKAQSKQQRMNHNKECLYSDQSTYQIVKSD